MLVDSFLDYILFEKGYSEKTIVNYRKDLEEFEAFFKEREEGLEWNSVDADVVRAWAVYLMDKCHCKTTSVNRKLSALRSFFKYLLSRKYVEADPMLRVAGPKNSKPLPVFVKEKQMDEILDATDFGDGFLGVRDRLIVEMLYETGFRRSEILSLRDADVDFSANVIRVTGKRNKQRIVPFGDRLREEMLKYLDVRRQAFDSCSGSFFVNPKNGAINADCVYRVVKKALQKVVALKKCSPHVLRHSFATSMLNHNADLVSVKELLGHESLSTTEVYTHTTFEELKKVYKQAHPRA